MKSKNTPAKTKKKTQLPEAEFAVKFSRLSLQLVGVWPDLECSRLFTIISNIVFFISLVLIAYFIFVAQTTKLFLIGGDLDTIVDILCTADIPVSIALMKMIVLRYDSQVVKSLIYKMYEDWKMPQTSEQTATMRENARIGRRIAATCVGVAYGTSVVFFFLRLILLRQKEALTGKRGFLFESHFPTSVYETPWFEIVWLLQGFCTFSATTAYSGIDSFFAVLVLHLCGQLTTLRDQLRSLEGDRDGCSVKENIAKIVRKHNELNRFAETIEEIFNRMFLFQILGCIFQFCLQGYQIVTIAMDTTIELPILQLIFMTMYICYMSLDLYIYCFVAEKLRGKSLDICAAAYECKWYNFQPKETFDLMFVMKRAQFPLEITAGKFCSLSLRLFCAIGKTSLGYLSMLLAVKERQKMAEII